MSMKTAYFKVTLKKKGQIVLFDNGHLFIFMLIALVVKTDLVHSKQLPKINPVLD